MVSGWCLRVSDMWPILHKTPLAGGVWVVSGGVWMVSGMYLRTEEVSGCSNPLAKF